MKLIAVMLVVVGAALAYTVPAYAGDETPAPDKVFVCKYVGTPGVNETLQTGQNPISVSISSISGFPGVGGFFADAQGRSLVLAFDTGQGEDGLSCPGGEGCTVDCPQPDVFAATATCNEETGEFDVGGTVNGLAALVSILHIAGSVNGDTTITVTLGDKVKDVVVHTTGDCGGAGPPREIPTLDVVCDQANNQYLLTGAVDGQAATTTPSVIVGSKVGFTIVSVTLGEFTQNFLVETDGTCVMPPPPPPGGPPNCVPTGAGQDGNIPPNGNTNDNCIPLPKPTVPSVTPTTAPFTPPTITPTQVTKPTVVAKPKPKPVRKPVAKKKVIVHKAKPKPKPTVHICKPVNGHMRVWVKTGPNKGCQYVGKPEPDTLTG